MKKYFTSDDNCNGSSYFLCTRNHKKIKTTAKMLKRDGAGMAFVSETID
jgi:hypothetical protein